MADVYRKCFGCLASGRMERRPTQQFIPVRRAEYLKRFFVLGLRQSEQGREFGTATYGFEPRVG